MKKILFAGLAIVLILSVCAGCGGNAKTETAAEAPAAAPAEVTWADYQNWLIDTFGQQSPDPEGYAALVRSFGSWDEIDLTTQPWDKMLGEDYFNASTFEEFVAAGGVGTYNTEYVDSNEGAGEPPSGEPSTEPAA